MSVDEYVNFYKYEKPNSKKYLRILCTFLRNVYSLDFRSIRTLHIFLVIESEEYIVE